LLCSAHTLPSRAQRSGCSLLCVPWEGRLVDRIRVKGGRALGGAVHMSGSKNAALPILAATLLVDGVVRLDNVPQLTDIDNLLRGLQLLSVCSHRVPDGSLELVAVDKTIYDAPYDLVRTMRASFVVLGPLWARRGVGRVSNPGGCVIG